MTTANIIEITSFIVSVAIILGVSSFVLLELFKWGYKNEKK